MAIVVKAVRPKKLNEKAFKQELTKAARLVRDDMQAEFRKTVKGWEGAKPTFESVIEVSDRETSVLVGPGGNEEGAQKWEWLNSGTKPHVIAAKGAGRLAFYASGFQSKTMPGVLSTRGGRKAASDFTRPQAVMHPGTEARKWDEMIQKIYQPRFQKRMEKAIRDGNRAAGHAIS